MRKGLTELVFLLDRSGSMAGLERDTIGGFNAMLEKQRQAPGEAYVSTVLFSSGSTVLHDRVDIRRVEPMTGTQYRVGGGTAGRRIARSIRCLSSSPMARRTPAAAMTRSRCGR